MRQERRLDHPRPLADMPVVGDGIGLTFRGTVKTSMKKAVARVECKRRPPGKVAGPSRSRLPERDAPYVFTVRAAPSPPAGVRERRSRLRSRHFGKDDASGVASYFLNPRTVNTYDAPATLPREEELYP